MLRRSFLLGLGAAVCAPAIIRPGLLMPVKRMFTDGIALTAIEHPYSQMIEVAVRGFSDEVLETVMVERSSLERGWGDLKRPFGIVVENRPKETGLFLGDVVTLR